ncbi:MULTISPECIES: hypothetical protein [unclassified Pseudomonas]|uniref:hypothetical protein n=1 Tax=unclassified Pseudomonas TaxID=196821 RepID=UPI002448C993|nr:MULTISPECIES: hypothetical protein [unclassified Pseudomonas]MDG9927847.1 hypothetical protein [Pseudomonas sp. GD04042]MDH0483054.1 hypothetical protein [Pseudomonas sp. GD04015]MDH0605247.1 hypothetical protein [Pseudomonas sp. GD03869]
MKIGQPKLILNPYEWLPGYGESKVSFRSVGADVILDVEYERDASDIDGVDVVLGLRREIVFKFVRDFVRTPFPGSTFFEFEGDSSKFGLGELTEFVDSEFVRSSLESSHSVSSGELSGIRHFSIQFLSENVAFHVLAEDVILSGEQLIS